MKLELFTDNMNATSKAAIQLLIDLYGPDDTRRVLEQWMAGNSCGKVSTPKAAQTPPAETKSKFRSRLGVQITRLQTQALDQMPEDCRPDFEISRKPDVNMYLAEGLLMMAEKQYAEPGGALGMMLDRLRPTYPALRDAWNPKHPTPPERSKQRKPRP